MSAAGPARGRLKGEAGGRVLLTVPFLVAGKLCIERRLSALLTGICA